MGDTNTTRFRRGNTWQPCKTDKDVYIGALRALHRRVPDLFARLREQLRTAERTFFARVPDDIFLRSPHLANNQANYHQIVPGWFADTNVADRDKERILMQACVIADVSYTDEFEIEFNAWRGVSAHRSRKVESMDEKSFNQGLQTIHSAIDAALRQRGVRNTSISYTVQGRNSMQEATFTVVANGHSAEQTFAREEVADSARGANEFVNTKIGLLVSHFEQT